MGLKHLTKIAALMKQERKWYTVTEIRDTLNIYFYTVKECLSYFIIDGKIETSSRGDTTVYRWKK